MGYLMQETVDVRRSPSSRLNVPDDECVGLEIEELLVNLWTILLANDPLLLREEERPLAG